MPPPPAARGLPPRHRGLLLLGPRGAARLDSRLARRVLDRLLAPKAQIEGVDFHLSAPALPEAVAQAQAFALVLPPLGNLSNPFYSVHPRRNDRFIAARAPLKALFPEVEFGPLAFTGHALGTLAAACPERFCEMRRLISATWVRRMQRLLALLPPHGVLLDLPTAPWLPRPTIPGEGPRRICIDPEARGDGAELLRAGLLGYAA
ncbi:DUF6473 family protein [Pararhodobacter oceanensis]|nr:DUF6473 family protein [Pararhodobacter oceanensis]